MNPIFTQRLVLRRAREDDLEAMHRILSDGRAMLYWSSLPHETRADTQEWLDNMIAAPEAESCDFIIELNGRTIGKVGCYRVPEIGYIIHPDHWGKGYAKEALAAVIPHLFARFDMPALKADIDPRNCRSIKLLEGLGFTLIGRAERTWRIGEQWCDSVYYELKRP